MIHRQCVIRLAHEPITQPNVDMGENCLRVVDPQDLDMDDERVFEQGEGVGIVSDGEPSCGQERVSLCCFERVARQ